MTLYNLKQNALWLVFIEQGLHSNNVRLGE